MIRGEAIVSDSTPTATRKLDAFLRSEGIDTPPIPLTPDASTREYFRIDWHGTAAAACVYPEPFDDDLAFLDTTRLFLAASLPVAKILRTAPDRGIIVLEDLGDQSLGEFLETADPAVRDNAYDDAISLIAHIQAATGIAIGRGSVASRLRFDREKLDWELRFFLTHYFESYRKRPLSKSLEQSVLGEFGELAEELESYSRVLTHRDFHAANLMVAPERGLFMIDHQDARLGSAAYDLVSLLLDRITEAPDDEWLRRKRRTLLEERSKLGLATLDTGDFEYEFRLVAVQRCLKAIGTFANQAGNFGKTHYTKFIDPMFGIVSETCAGFGRFPAIREAIREAQAQ